MKKIYLLLFALAGISIQASAQCNVTFTYTSNGLTINANAVGTGTAIVPIYGWDWGDASNPSVGQNQSHTYAAAGTYTVCAYFFDLADTVSCNAQSCQVITVQPTSIQEANAGVTTISAQPSPFGATTTFNVQLAQNSNVEIAVYDITGKKVAVVKDGEMTSGKHEIQWTPGNLAEGVYFVQLKAGNSVVTKKIIHTATN
ncbi:MAG: hypothetical protein Fur0041_07770 [Bacteroidia bacterium]